MSNAESFWKHYTASKRYATHCSIDALFHAGALWVTRAVAVRREPVHG